MPRRAPLIALIVGLAPVVVGAVAVAAGVGASAARGNQDEPGFVIEGRGFGHGVGMSQYGARGRAQAGWTAARILAHYYSGTTLTTARTRHIRVLLSPDTPRVRVSSPAAWRVVGRTASGRRSVALRAGSIHTLRPIGARWVLVERAGRRIVLFRGPVTLRPTVARGTVSWGRNRPERARTYRGVLRVSPAGGTGLQMVNTVAMEDYLKGVVPKEMSPSWASGAAAALRAQAIAARSYALATMRPGSDFNVFDDTRSQVYGGVAAEDRRTNRAVDATRRTVLTYDGAIASTYFFSTSGGRTEDVQNAWTGSAPVPYLVAVDDRFDRVSPYHVWADPPRFSAARLGELLRVGGPVASVDVLERGSSPRVLSARVTTVDGASTVLSGADIRARLGLRDSWFTVIAR